MLECAGVSLRKDFLQELGERSPSPPCMGWGPELTELTPECLSGEACFTFCPHILTPMWVSLFRGNPTFFSL